MLRQGWFGFGVFSFAASLIYIGLWALALGLAGWVISSCVGLVFGA